MNVSLKKIALPALALLAAALLTVSVYAQKGGKCGDGGCDHCGCGGDCCVVCVLECTERTVEIPCWKCECEDFCLPGPCKMGCKSCIEVCSDCKGKGGKGGCGGGCGLFGGLCCFPKPFVYHEECPGCPKHYHKKKLFLKIEKVKIPSYKWVVSSCCDKCCDKLEGAEIAPEGEIPAPPAIEAATYKYRLRGEVVEVRNASLIPVGQRTVECDAISR